jgi:hypothetical protein
MSRSTKLVLILGLLVLLSGGLTVLVLARGSTAPALAMPTPISVLAMTTLSGVVKDAKGPVAGATVRIQATENKAVTGVDGSFILQGVSGTRSLTVTASLIGYYINWVKVKPGTKSVNITLTPHFTTDNVEYNWFVHDGIKGSAACGVCHTAYNEWKSDVHAETPYNQHFISMYKGTDVQGHQSPTPQTDRLGVPLPPDLTKPYYGPGFKLDNPDRTGVCAACHAPGAGKVPTTSGCGWLGCHNSATSQYNTKLVPPGVSAVGTYGAAADGISCEFCHKIAQVQINKQTGLPYEDSPGILSLSLLRPEPGHDIFFGPLDDIARADIETPRDSYLPLQKESTFCASCHYAVMGGIVQNMKVTGGVLIYSSFSEWLASKYSKPETGKSCQDCHMPAVNSNRFVFPEKGGQPRDYYPVHNHHMLGARDEQFLQNAVSMTAVAQAKGDQIQVDVSIINDRTGHSVPTDSPLREVLLVVTAKDASGKSLVLSSGAKLPDWAGNYAGQAGKSFAKVLQDQWTKELPTGAIWRPIKVVEDTRLAAGATDQTRYTFKAPSGTVAAIEVHLIYRRAPQQLMQWKDWDDPDIVMAQQVIKMTASQ